MTGSVAPANPYCFSGDLVLGISFLSVLVVLKYKFLNYSERLL